MTTYHDPPTLANWPSPVDNQQIASDIVDDHTDYDMWLYIGRLDRIGYGPT